MKRLLLALWLAGCAHEPAFPHALLTPSEPRTLPALALVDERGQRFDPGQAHRWLWVYFGYTHCPDVCPATLGRLAGAYQALKRPDDVRVLFVSVDPRRDTPAVLARTVRYFDPAFRGATGDRAALDAFTGALGARYADEPKGGVEHSDLVFVVDPQGRAVATYPSDPAGLQADFAAIEASGR